MNKQRRQQTASDVATCKLNHLRRPWCAFSGEEAPRCLPALAHWSHWRAPRPSQAGWWHEQPQLQRPSLCVHLAPNRETHCCREGGTVMQKSADEMKRRRDGKGEGNQQFTHDRSHLSRFVAPLVRCPSCAASTAARRTCQIHHRPAQLACPCKHRSLRSSPACQSSQSAPFRLCRCLNGKNWGLRRHRLRRASDSSNRVPNRRGRCSL